MPRSAPGRRSRRPSCSRGRGSRPASSSPAGSPATPPASAPATGRAAMARRRSVRVPATSANLGPGYDVLGAALELELVLDVEETGSYAFEAGDLEVPLGRDNLIVRSFERLHPADDISFRVSSEIPLARGLGSSPSAILAGLLAADHLYELGNSREELFELACEVEGHPDN